MAGNDHVTEKKILTWNCPKCSKVISSLFPRQLEQNKKAHLETHESQINSDNKSRGEQ